MVRTLSVLIYNNTQKEIINYTAGVTTKIESGKYGYIKNLCYPGCNLNILTSSPTFFPGTTRLSNNPKTGISAKQLKNNDVVIYNGVVNYTIAPEKSIPINNILKELGPNASIKNLNPWCQENLYLKNGQTCTTISDIMSSRTQRESNGQITTYPLVLFKGSKITNNNGRYEIRGGPQPPSYGLMTKKSPELSPSLGLGGTKSPSPSPGGTKSPSPSPGGTKSPSPSPSPGGTKSPSPSPSPGGTKSKFGESGSDSLGLIVILFLIIAGLMFYFRSPSKKKSFFGIRK